MNAQRLSRRAPLAILLLPIVCGAVGCATLPPAAGMPDPAGAIHGSSHPGVPTGGATVTMTIRAERHKPVQKTLPLTPGMTVQSALEEAKLTRRFKNMDIHVMRVTPQSKGQPVPLRAEYDSIKKRVGILHDMALHPGDHIVVAENTTTAFDKAVGRVTGAFGGQR